MPLERSGKRTQFSQRETIEEIRIDFFFSRFYSNKLSRCMYKSGRIAILLGPV